MWTDLAERGEAPGCVAELNAALWPKAAAEGALLVTLRVLEDG